MVTSTETVTSAERVTSAEIATSTGIAMWHQKTRLMQQIEAIGYNSAFSSDALSRTYKCEVSSDALSLSHKCEVESRPESYHYMLQYYRSRPICAYARL